MLTALLLTVAADAGVLDDVQALAAARAHRLAQRAPAVSDDVYRRAERGEIVTGVTYVDGQAAGKGWAVGVSDLPVEDLWRAVNAEDRYVGRFGGLTASAVIAGPPHGAPRTLFQAIDLPMVSDRWWVVSEAFGAAAYTASGGRLWECAWTDATHRTSLAGTPHGAIAASGVPVGFSEGAWLLVPLSDGRTLMEFYTWTDPGGAVPAGLATRFASGTMIEAFADLEAVARELAGQPSRGYTRPDGAPM